MYSLLNSTMLQSLKLTNMHIPCAINAHTSIAETKKKTKIEIQINNNIPTNVLAMEVSVNLLRLIVSVFLRCLFKTDKTSHKTSTLLP